MTLSFQCRCGDTAWHMPGRTARHGTHLMCYCRDCRAWARSLGAENRLAPGGGLAVFVTRPDWITFTHGAANLAAMKLSAGGLERWHAACCDTPVSSHLQSVISFCGVTAMNAVTPASLGPVRAAYATGSALPDPDVPPKDFGFAALFSGVLARGMAARLTGRRKSSPFLKEGAPIAPARVLTAEARAALADPG